MITRRRGEGMRVPRPPASEKRSEKKNISPGSPRFSHTNPRANIVLIGFHYHFQLMNIAKIMNMSTSGKPFFSSFFLLLRKNEPGAVGTPRNGGPLARPVSKRNLAREGLLFPFLNTTQCPRHLSRTQQFVVLFRNNSPNVRNNYLFLFGILSARSSD